MFKLNGGRFVPVVGNQRVILANETECVGAKRNKRAIPPQPEPLQEGGVQVWAAPTKHWGKEWGEKDGIWGVSQTPSPFPLPARDWGWGEKKVNVGKGKYLGIRLPPIVQLDQLFSAPHLKRSERLVVAEQRDWEQWQALVEGFQGVKDGQLAELPRENQIVLKWVLSRWIFNSHHQQYVEFRDAAAGLNTTLPMIEARRKALAEFQEDWKRTTKEYLIINEEPVTFTMGKGRPFFKLSYPELEAKNVETRKLEKPAEEAVFEVALRNLKGAYNYKTRGRDVEVIGDDEVARRFQEEEDERAAQEATDEEVARRFQEEGIAVQVEERREEPQGGRRELGVLELWGADNKLELVERMTEEEAMGYLRAIKQPDPRKSNFRVEQPRARLEHLLLTWDIDAVVRGMQEVQWEGELAEVRRGWQEQVDQFVGQFVVRENMGGGECGVCSVMDGLQYLGVDPGGDRREVRMGVAEHIQRRVEEMERGVGFSRGWYRPALLGREDESAMRRFFDTAGEGGDWTRAQNVDVTNNFFWGAADLYEVNIVLLRPTIRGYERHAHGGEESAIIFSPLKNRVRRTIFIKATHGERGGGHYTFLEPKYETSGYEELLTLRRWILAFIGQAVFEGQRWGMWLSMVYGAEVQSRGEADWERIAEGVQGEFLAKHLQPTLELVASV